MPRIAGVHVMIVYHRDCLVAFSPRWEVPPLSEPFLAGMAASLLSPVPHSGLSLVIFQYSLLDAIFDVWLYTQCFVKEVSASCLWSAMLMASTLLLEH